MRRQRVESSSRSGNASNGEFWEYLGLTITTNQLPDLQRKLLVDHFGPGESGRLGRRGHILNWPGWVRVACFLCWCGGVSRASTNEFLVDRWLSNEGVPENSALGLAQTGDGYMWVGTPDGLLRFNGLEFTHVLDSKAPESLKTVVNMLSTDRLGRLWIGAEGGVAVRDQSGWRAIKAPKTVLRSVASDSEGRVLLGGLYGELFTLKGDDLVSFPPPPQLATNGVFCATDARDGGLWLANRGFVGRLVQGEWKPIGQPPVSTKYIVAVAGRTEGIWTFSTGELKHYHADGTVDSVSAPELELPRAMIEDASGWIWVVSSSRGALRFKPGGGPLRITSKSGLAHNTLWCICEDSEGDIWMGGSYAGLNRLKRRRFITLSEDDGLPDNKVQAIVEVNPGEIMVGTHGGGMAIIRDHRVVFPQPPGPLPHHAFIWSLLKDGEGRMWLGDSVGLYLREHGAERRLPFPGLKGASVNSLVPDQYGRIWVGASSGLGLIERDQWLWWSTNSLLANACITCVAEEVRTGDVYAGTYDGGIFVLDKGDPGRLRHLPDTRHFRLSSLTADRDGCIWAGVYGMGLLRIRDGKLAWLGRKDGLPADAVSSMVDDGLGWFWLGTPSGVLRVSREGLHALADGTVRDAMFNRFTTSDGLESDFCTEAHQPVVLKDSLGQLWFATFKGVASIDPASLVINTSPAPAFVQKLVYSDRWGSNQIVHQPSAKGVVIPAGSTELSIHFDVLSFSSPEKVRLFYDLEGDTSGWVELIGGRDLRFPSLSPKTYSVRLKTINSDGVIRDGVTRLTFKVAPFFWQTVWFPVLGFLVFAGAGGYAAWRFSHHRLRRRIEFLQNQRALEHERARLATILEATSDLVAFADSQGNILHLNPAGCALLGLKSEASRKGLRLAEIQPKWAAERITNEGIPFARLHGSWEGEAALKTGEGQEIPVSQVIIVHKDESGRDNFLSTIARDISERKRAELEMRRQEEWFRSLIENASDMITVLNRDGLITFQSPSSQRVIGLAPTEMVGHGSKEFIHPDDLDPAEAILSRLNEHPGVPVTLAFRLKHRDGSWRRIEAVGRGLPGATAGDWILNSRDMTDSLKLEEQFRQAQKMDAVGQLSGGIAHDFNNLLTVIMGHLALLEMHPGLPGAMAESLRSIGQASRRAATLTRQLLAVSRRQPLAALDVDLNELVTRMAGMLRRILGEDIQMKLELARQPLWGHVDAGMIEQVLLNLVINARDAMPGGGRLSLSTAVVNFSASPQAPGSPARPGAFICLSVSDTGKGIPPEVLPHIFEPFFTTKDVGKGTGLGLATVYGIVQQHRGWVAVSNEPGAGACFKVYLPRTERTGPRILSSVAPGEMPQGRETILIVEDEPALRLLMRSTLRRLGYTILEAASGPKALEVWAEHRSRIQLVLTDMVMPDGMAGRELAQRLLQDQPDLKIIYTSGYSAEIAARGFPLTEGVNFLSKPFIPARLAQIIRTSLDAKGAGNQTA